MMAPIMMINGNFQQTPLGVVSSERLMLAVVMMMMMMMMITVSRSSSSSKLKPDLEQRTSAKRAARALSFFLSLATTTRAVACERPLSKEKSEKLAEHKGCCCC